MKTARILGLALLALTAGCGKKAVLSAADGKPMPPKAATAPVAEGVTKLLTPATQAQPSRSDELIVKSQVLQSDRFDLPPPG